MRRRRALTAPRPLLVGLAALLVVLLAGCDPQTAGTPDDAVPYTVEFDHVDNLVRGHDVRVADVVVGQVAAIELTDELRAEVRLLLQPGVPVAEGTVASIRRTSLLGEDFVALSLPADVTVDTPRLPAGSVLPTGGRPASVEEVVERGIAVLGAIGSDDLASLVDSGLEIVDGRESQLRGLIEDVGLVTSTYADETERIGVVIEGIGDLGDELARGREQLATAIDTLADGVAVGARERDRVVTAVAALDRVRRAMAGGPLGDRSDEFRAMLDELGGTAADLAARDEQLVALLHGTRDFVQRIPANVTEDGEVDLYILVLLSGAGQPIGSPDELSSLLEPPR